jgi:hypothetical protein
MLEPVSVGLKFGFLAVLYLFLIWIARSSLKDLMRPGSGPMAGAGYLQPSEPRDEETGLHTAAPQLGADPRLLVERAPGHAPGMEYEIGEGAVIGRGQKAEIRIEDTVMSARHARFKRQGGVIVVEDLGSTNGTFLNEELLGGPQPLHPGDRLQLGDSEFTYWD